MIFAASTGAEYPVVASSCLTWPQQMGECWIKLGAYRMLITKALPPTTSRSSGHHNEIGTSGAAFGLLIVCPTALSLAVLESGNIPRTDNGSGFTLMVQIASYSVQTALSGSIGSVLTALPDGPHAAHDIMLALAKPSMIYLSTCARHRSAVTPIR